MGIAPDKSFQTTRGLLLLLLPSPARLMGFTILVRFFSYVTVFYSNHLGSHMLSSWMVHAGCVFVAGIHPSRTWMSGSFESVWWNACMHRLDLGLYSHPKKFWGNGVRNHVNSKGKILSTWKIFLRGGSNPQCCIKQDSEPNTLPVRYSSPLWGVWGHACLASCSVLQTEIVRLLSFLQRKTAQFPFKISYPRRTTRLFNDLKTCRAVID